LWLLQLILLRVFVFLQVGRLDSSVFSSSGKKMPLPRLVTNMIASSKNGNPNSVENRADPTTPFKADYSSSDVKDIVRVQSIYRGRKARSEADRLRLQEAARLHSNVHPFGSNQTPRKPLFLS
jgi:hypothetical protein